MTIERIESFLLNQVAFVRVVDSDGAEGWGQVSPYHADISVAVLHGMIAPYYLGRPTDDFEGLASDAVTRLHKFTGSFVCRAVGGIDTALWDLRGKREGKPVAALLNPEHRSAVRIYGSSMSRDIAPEAEAERFAAWRAGRGVTAFKCRVGSWDSYGRNLDQSPGRSEALVPCLRRGLGDDVSLLADGNSAYDEEGAVRLGTLLEDYGYDYFEEPCPWWEYEMTARVRRRLSIPVCGGEQDSRMTDWERMISGGMVHTVQPDVCYIGGFSRTLRVARLAEARGMLCMPHAANLSYVTVFSAHLLAAIPNAGHYLEYSIEAPAWAEGLFTEPVSVSEGCVTIGSGPGWGYTPNPDKLKGAVKRVSSR